MNWYMKHTTHIADKSILDTRLGLPLIPSESSWYREVLTITLKEWIEELETTLALKCLDEAIGVRHQETEGSPDGLPF
jgi:hypothetical protein